MDYGGENDICDGESCCDEELNGVSFRMLWCGGVLLTTMNEYGSLKPSAWRW